MRGGPKSAMIPATRDPANAPNQVRDSSPLIEDCELVLLPRPWVGCRVLVGFARTDKRRGGTYTHTNMRGDFWIPKASKS